MVEDLACERLHSRRACGKATLEVKRLSFRTDNVFCEISMPFNIPLKKQVVEYFVKAYDTG